MEDDTESIENWVVDIHRKLNERKGNHYQFGRSTTIFRAPPKLFDVRNSAFLPKIISIGPYHRKIDTMYDHKIGFLLRVLEGKSGEINASEIERETESQYQSHKVSEIEEETESLSLNMVSEIEEETQSQSQSHSGNMVPEIEEESESQSHNMEPEIEEESESQSHNMVPEIEEESESQSHNMVPEIEEESESLSRNMVPVESQSRNMVRLHDLVKAIQDLELKTRECYSKPCDDLSRSDFVRMMVTEGCFVIELLRLHNKVMQEERDKMEEEMEEEEDCYSPARPPYRLLINRDHDSPILTTRWLLRSLQCDIIKLENQIPYFVLEVLFSLTTAGSEPPLQQLFATFFGSIWSHQRSVDVFCDSPAIGYAHPLDHFRLFFINSIRQQEYVMEHRLLRIRETSLIYSAQELQEAGVSFSNVPLMLLDIRFSNGVLHMSPLSIDETTTTMLLNFVAYEQSDHTLEPFFTNYLLFLDSLINTIKDVEILHKNGILKYSLGSEKEVVDLFNNFCREIAYEFDQTYLSVDMDAVNRYCKAFYNNKCRFWWSNLKKERFGNPWAWLSLLAAIVLLTLTMLQTFFTIFPLYYPYHRH